MAVLAGAFGLLDQERPAGSSKVPAVEWGRLDAAGLRSAAESTGKAIAALEHQQRLVLAEIDRRKAYAADGARDAADWAANQLGISRQKANEQVRLAEQLTNMPRLADAAANGELTTEQAAPAAQLAEVDGTDATWGAQAPKLPVGVLNRHAGKARRPSVQDRRAAHGERFFTSHDDGGLLTRFRGALPTDEAARVLAAIERAMPANDPNAPATLNQRRADGLAALAGAALGADTDPDRATIAVVAELAAITDDDPTATAELETGQPLATDTIRRLVCDGRIQVVIQDRDGIAVGVGTTARVVTPAMRRAVMRRDGRCRFPGCTATAMLQAHHVTPWPAPTTMGNLAMLCWFHHHLIHEGGWTLTGDPNTELRATNHTGTRTLTSWPRDRLPHPPGSPPGRAAPSSGEPVTQARGSRSARGAPPDHPRDTGPPDHQAGLFDDPG